MLNGSAGIGAGVEPRQQAPATAEGAAAAAAPVATTLSAVGGGTTVVVRDGQGAVVFRGPLATGEVQQLEVEPPVTVEAGDGMLLVVRPHDVALAVHGPGVAATVLGTEFEGPTRTYRVRLPSGAEVAASTPHTFQVAVGSTVHVTLRPGDHAVVSSD